MRKPCEGCHAKGREVDGRITLRCVLGKCVAGRSGSVSCGVAVFGISVVGTSGSAATRSFSESGPWATTFQSPAQWVPRVKATTA